MCGIVGLEKECEGRVSVMEEVCGVMSMGGGV